MKETTHAGERSHAFYDVNLIRCWAFWRSDFLEDGLGGGQVSYPAIALLRSVYKRDTPAAVAWSYVQGGYKSSNISSAVLSFPREGTRKAAPNERASRGWHTTMTTPPDAHQYPRVGCHIFSLDTNDTFSKNQYLLRRDPSIIRDPIVSGAPRRLFVKGRPEIIPFP